MTVHADETFLRWLEALDRRHLAELSPAEVRRALQALSARYVGGGRRGLSQALDTGGKRAAYALFYGPLHFLTIRGIVGRLAAQLPAPARLLDLGCGTGAAAAAWILETRGKTQAQGVDRRRWAIAETLWTWGVLDLEGRARASDVGKVRLPGPGAGIVAAYTANELDDHERDRLLGRLLAAARRGASVLIVEPIARRVTPWWDDWSGRFAAAGGRDDDWRFEVTLPDSLRRLDRAAGMDHGQLTARSLWLPGGP